MALSLAELNRGKVSKFVEREYKSFKRRACRLSKKQIFESYLKISFYEKIYRYFTDCEWIPDEITNRLADKSTIIEELWQMLMKCDDFYVNTWTDIEDLLLIYFEDKDFLVKY